ncbi:MAG: glycoside hydrolase family 31 protein [Bacteroidota bacterium]
MTEVSAAPSRLLFRCGDTATRLTLLADGLLRVDLSPTGAFGDGFSYALDPNADWPGPNVLAMSEEAATLRTGAMEVRVDRATGCVSVLTLDGQAVLEDAAAPSWSRDGIRLSKRLREHERLLGLGDKTAGIDRRGGRYEHWNTDAFAFQRGTDPVYKSIPFVLGIATEETPSGDDRALAYGLFVDTPRRSFFDLGAHDPACLRVEAETDRLTYYVFHAATPVEIVQQFTRLTGRPPMWPKWALGYHQCRYSYKTESEIRAVARGFRERGIPCDSLYFDIHYMDGYRVFTWDRDAFPDPAGLIGSLHDEDFHTIVMVDPGIKADDPDYAVAQDGIERDMFCRMPDGSLATGPVWPGPCYFPDYTRPEARAWWGTLHRDLVEMGVDGVWNDMNEPAVFDPDKEGEGDVEEDALTLPDEMRHSYEGRGADHATMHNVYGMQMVRSTYEGLARLRPERRPFVITRAAYPGTQRYATGWTGDNSSTWDHLLLALQQCLSLNASGFAFAGADVGGFVGAPSGELLARWTQLGALTPLFRNHSGLDTPPQEPWALGPETERVCREAIELRYRLLPYLYTVLHQAASDALPILRPLALMHPGDVAIRLENPAGFYVGDRLLAYPVLNQGQAHTDVYLPVTPGGWFDFWTGARHEGGQTLRVETPLDVLPLWVCAGSVLPLGPVRQHTGGTFDTLTLRVYPTRGAFSDVLYDDAGDGWDFERGGFYRCTFHGTCDDEGVRITSGTEGTFPAPWTRWAVEVFGVTPVEVLADGEPVEFEHDEVCTRFTVRPSQSFTVRT